MNDNFNDSLKVTEFNLRWQGIDEVSQFTKKLANTIYIEAKFEEKENGKDFYLDLNFKEQSKNTDLIVTRWGADALTSFYCISGYVLFDLIPWWKVMQTFFEESLGLHSWLPFPCLLLSQSNLRRHSDKGRKTAFNYPIFGQEFMTNYIWNNMEDSDKEYVDSYSYKTGKTILLDTTSFHGGIVNSGYKNTELRAICNMGFKENFTECYKIIKAAELSGQLNSIQ